LTFRVSALDDAAEHQKERGSAARRRALPLASRPGIASPTSSPSIPTSSPYLAQMVPPQSFTAQFEMVLIAAAALPRERRDGFLRAVAAAVPPDPTDSDLLAALPSEVLYSVVRGRQR
jgi:hypothetical protein